MGLKKKIKSFIKDDRPAKLKSLVSSHDVDLSDIRFSGGRNALHYCAEYGSADMMRCLLRLECDPMIRDREGRLPLHTILNRCLDHWGHAAKQIYDDLVNLLVRVSPMSLDVEDRDGVTCHDLLNRVKARLKSCQPGMHGQVPSVEDEEKWQQKLASESQFEFEEQQFQHDYVEDYSDREEEESFSSWSDRLHQEYHQKRAASKGPSRSSQSSSNPRKRPGFSTQDGKRKKPKTQTHPDPEEELRKAREEMRKNYKPPIEKSSELESLVSKKERYEKRFVKFSKSPHAHGSVTFAAVPWPCTNMDNLLEVLFCDLPDKSSDVYKKFWRKERVRWHPDKFLQRFRELLHPNHMDKIMGRVKLISQTLNAMAR